MKRNSIALIVSEIEMFTRTKGHRQIDSGSNPDQEYIYFMGSETLPSTYYILFPDYNISFYSISNGYSDEHPIKYPGPIKVSAQYFNG